MGQMSQEEINVDLFDEVKRLKQENELLKADNGLLRAKWEAQGLMIQKLHEENRKYEKALSQVVFAGTKEMKTEIAKSAVHFF
jgi:hypothetical protein